MLRSTPVESLAVQDKVAKDDLMIIENSKQYIDQHLGGDLSLVTIASRVHMNPSYFSRLFKKVTGENLSRYIQKCRIDKAKELLGKTQYRVNEIGERLGFESPAYFTTYFKRATGYTPQHYRDICLLKQLDIM